MEHQKVLDLWSTKLRPENGTLPMIIQKQFMV